MIPYKRCLLLLADGARPDLFQELCGKGLLPHCERLFKKRGRFTGAVSVFPSTTGPAYLPFLTGCYPGSCDIPGIRWFHKKKYGEGKPFFKRFRSYVGFESFFMNSDIRISHPTLFEYFNSPVNIFSAINKGSSFKTNKTKQSRIWYWYYAHLTDHWSVPDAAATEKLLQALDEETDFAFVVFPGIDEFSHLSHPHHEKTVQAYLHIDQTLGKIIHKLEKQNQLDETLIAIVSDHGLSATYQHFGVASFLESRGLKTFYYPKIFKKNFDVASMVSGNGMLHLYFKDVDGWKNRSSIEAIEKKYPGIISSLLEQEAIDLVAAKSPDGSLVVLSRKGKAKIGLDDQKKIHYSVEKNDPFGYPVFPSSMTDRDSLKLTFDTEYPDALVQLLQIFRSDRTGDLVVSATKGFDLRKRFEHPEHRSSHGGLIREHMMVPFFINAPISEKYARTCDVFPTLLKLMGKEIPETIDGVSLV